MVSDGNYNNNYINCCEMGRLERDRESQHCLPKDILFQHKVAYLQ